MEQDAFRKAVERLENMTDDEIDKALSLRKAWKDRRAEATKELAEAGIERYAGGSGLDMTDYVMSELHRLRARIARLEAHF